MSRVAEYYDAFAQGEWERLERYRIEHAVTLRIFADYLPPAPAAILDLGGGPGRFSIALAGRGYQVTLADISARELEMARDKAREAGVRLADVVHVSGTDLASLPEGTFDAALIMGPLYHLLRLEERERVVREAWRVLKPGGRVFAAFVTRYAFFRNEIRHKPGAIMESLDFYKQLLATGELPAPMTTTAFTDAYLCLPEEVRPLMEGCGFDTLGLVGVEGMSCKIDEAVNKLEGGAWEAWVELSYQIGRQPSAYGASDHLLYVGRKC